MAAIDQWAKLWEPPGVAKSVVVVDNYDSFTYNLVQYLQALGADVRVHLNDQVTVEQLRDKLPDGILLSPGPGRPEDAGVTLSLIEQLAGKLPIFGVCLGHQSIGQCFGGNVIRAPRLMHGKTSWVHHDGKTIYHGLPNPFEATRYHSLVVEKSSLPDCLEVTATTDQDEVMGLRHRYLPIEGVQFHPESFLTQNGMDLVSNWLRSL
jgi:anthranilate synthase/aminodeoxychorismate synthase-like glutamine amidotransferase